MTSDALSLFFVNGATGLMFGMSVGLARDVFPVLRQRHLWWVLFAVIAAWFAVIMWTYDLETPNDIVIRRCLNATVELWVAVLLWFYMRKPRAERKSR